VEYPATLNEIERIKLYVWAHDNKRLNAKTTLLTTIISDHKYYAKHFEKNDKYVKREKQNGKIDLTSRSAFS